MQEEGAWPPVSLNRQTTYRLPSISDNQGSGGIQDI